MVRVLDVRTLDGCLDSSAAREVVLDRGVTEELMRSIAVGASLQYFPHFPRPYYRITHQGRWVIQGVLGATTFRVTAPTAAHVDLDDALRRLVEARPESVAESTRG